MILLEPLDARIPQWDILNLTTRLCPFCGVENEPVLMRPDQLPVAFCNTCGSWYVARLPFASEIKKVYDSYYHNHRPTDLSGKRVSHMLKNARKASRTDWRLHTLSQLLGGINGKRILDVGCGLGDFLLMARSAGANVVGCDLSPEACEFAENRLGITVHKSELHSCSSSIGNVDAVVMKDLIEHPVNPLINIQVAYSILKPGGLLLLHTPNGGEAGTNVETAKKWVGFRVDLEHLQYLSPHTINWLSRKTGLGIERLEVFGFPDLKGKDKLPNKRFGITYSAREIAKNIPCMCKMVRTLRVLKAEISGEYCDPRLGSYHLFAVFRKI
ncbi:MAG: class I SAM-dependent methyltransferase [Planctomycetes bacterium]|nr:class I SAM-dependent methyltransferase [Planctomycetota bacterium]